VRYSYRGVSRRGVFDEFEERDGQAVEHIKVARGSICRRVEQRNLGRTGLSLCWGSLRHGKKHPVERVHSTTFSRRMSARVPRRRRSAVTYQGLYVTLYPSAAGTGRLQWLQMVRARLGGCASRAAQYMCRSMGFVYCTTTKPPLFSDNIQTMRHGMVSPRVARASFPLFHTARQSACGG
jgi:hypothetical protein